MSYSIQITIGGATYPIARDVATTHPQAVHDALGTGSESELQAMLDQCYVGDWYGADGQHLGPDATGMEMFWADGLQSLVGQRVEAGEGEDRDTGRVERIIDPRTAYVAWDSGVKTPAAIGDLTVL